MAFKAYIDQVYYDTKVDVEKGERYSTVKLTEVGTNTVLAQISYDADTSFPVLGRYEFYVDTTSANAYLANQLVQNELAVLVKRKKHIRENRIYLVYRMVR